ncbi:Thaumatin [Corchorus capsularis]|uniref:Thaumatin n=1 Tax=Corchorus capsularis TaxID=210143 RepID=A0A1R3GLY5_COCAP|nr:Thaumatin [Corchorus capsularis]
MVPISGGVGCGVAACEANLNVCCPATLAVKKQGKVVGCKSACLAAKTDRYCCTGQFANPKSCKPTVFANLFKSICPELIARLLMILQVLKLAGLLAIS